jgi:hypothetical protein
MTNSNLKGLSLKTLSPRMMDGEKDGVNKTNLPGVGRNATSACTGWDTNVLTKKATITNHKTGLLFGYSLIINNTYLTGDYYLHDKLVCIIKVYNLK